MRPSLVRRPVGSFIVGRDRETSSRRFGRRTHDFSYGFSLQSTAQSSPRLTMDFLRLSALPKVWAKEETGAHDVVSLADGLPRRQTIPPRTLLLLPRSSSPSVFGLLKEDRMAIGRRL